MIRGCRQNTILKSESSAGGCKLLRVVQAMAIGEQWQKQDENKNGSN